MERGETGATSSKQNAIGQEVFRSTRVTHSELTLEAFTDSRFTPGYPDAGAGS